MDVSASGGSCHPQSFKVTAYAIAHNLPEGPDIIIDNLGVRMLTFQLFHCTS